MTESRKIALFQERDHMLDVGLWIQTAADKEGAAGGVREVFLIKKDAEGHPALTSIRSSDPLEHPEAQKAKLQQLYEQLTGHPHPYPHATSRQLMWDFLEAAIKNLP